MPGEALTRCGIHSGSEGTIGRMKEENVMVGALLLLVVLALIFGAGTVFHLAANVLAIILIVALVLGVLGMFGMRGRSSL